MISLTGLFSVYSLTVGEAGFAGAGAGLGGAVGFLSDAPLEAGSLEPMPSRLKVSGLGSKRFGLGTDLINLANCLQRGGFGDMRLQQAQHPGLLILWGLRVL
jgi:hypothetical protein